MNRIIKTEKSTGKLKNVGSILILSVCLLAAGCSLDQKGMVVLIDKSYRVAVVGTEKSGFAVADGLLWKTGKLYISDEGGNAVRVWENFATVKTFCDASLGIKSPEDLVMDNRGNIFFTDDDAGGLWKIDAQGKPSLVAGKDKGLISTEGVAVSPEGKILVGDDKRHQVFSVEPKTGEVSVFLGAEYGIKKPESMVYDEKGNLFIADNDENVLYLLTPDKRLHRTIENREFFSPETILYANGVLYITDSQNGKLFAYTAQDGLRTIAVFGGKLAEVGGITADDAGNIYLSVQTNLKQKVGYVLRLEKETHQ